MLFALVYFVLGRLFRLLSVSASSDVSKDIEILVLRPWCKSTGPPRCRPRDAKAGRSGPGLVGPAPLGLRGNPLQALRGEMHRADGRPVSWPAPRWRNPVSG